MRSYLSALLTGLIATFTLAAPALAQTAPAVIKNIKTDFGATCNDVANDSRAFVNFNAWARRWQQGNSGLIELDIPSGSVCILTAGHWEFGIKKLLMKGYGATLKGHFFLGAPGMRTGADFVGKVASVSAGATSVTLTKTSDASKFSVGSWALISGYDLQGLLGVDYGYPPNWEFMEYVQIAGVDGSTITFTAPLKYTYLSTWPTFNLWNGGPAQLNVMPREWDTEVEYQGLHISMPGQIYSNGRNITFTDVTFDDACDIPTQNKTWTYNNVTCGQMIEADKLVESVIINGGTLRGIDFQSSSIDLLQMNGTTVTGFIAGTPKKAVISNSHIADFHPGTLWYGHTDEVSCTNCAIDTFGWYGTLYNVNSSLSMSNGIITVPKNTPNGAGDITWAVPGNDVFFAGAQVYEIPFKILGVTQDGGGNVFVQTDQIGGWPSTALWYQGTALGIRQHPAPKFTCTNCTGDPAVVDLSQAPAGAPLWTYSKRTYTGTLLPYPHYPPPVNMWGKLVSIKINVTKPYTGILGSLSLQAMDTSTIKQSDNTWHRYTPMIDLKTVGERVVTPAGVTGAQPGDFALSLPGPVTLTGDVGPLMGYPNDISSEPSSVWPVVTIEIQTDQGIVATSTGSPPPPPPPPPPTTAKQPQQPKFSGATTAQDRSSCFRNCDDDYHTCRHECPEDIGTESIACAQRCVQQINECKKQCNLRYRLPPPKQ